MQDSKPTTTETATPNSSMADIQALFGSIITLVQNGNHADLEQLLSSNPEPLVQTVINNGLAQEWFKYGPQGETPLHIACRRNDLDTARVLISHGASVTVVNSVKRTPLEVCSPENAETLRALAESQSPKPSLSNTPSSSNLAPGIVEGMGSLSLGSEQPSGSPSTSPPVNPSMQQNKAADPAMSPAPLEPLPIGQMPGMGQKPMNPMVQQQKMNPMAPQAMNPMMQQQAMNPMMQQMPMGQQGMNPMGQPGMNPMGQQ